MIMPELTRPHAGAKPLSMIPRVRSGPLGAACGRFVGLSTLLLAIGGCVNVNAPAEPIVIELNVNIRQEVLYKLVDSARENIEENPEIF